MTPERNKFPILLLLALASAEMITSVELSMIYVALPKIVAQYGSPTKAYWVITIYLIVATASVTLAARVGDLIGRKKVLVCVLGLVLCGSLTSAFTTSYAGLLTGRALMGFIAAAIPLCFGLIREHFPAGKVALGVGLAAAIPSIGGVTAMLVGGLVIDAGFDWRAIFFVSAAFTSMSAMLIFLVVPPDKQERSRPVIDWLGGLIMVLAILSLLGGINLGKAQGWLTVWPVSLFISCIVLWAIWIWHELRHPAPLVDLRLLAQRKVLLTNVVMILLALSSIQAPGVISIMLQQPTWTLVGFGVAAATMGLLHIPLAGTNLIAGLLSGYISSKRGARNAALIGISLNLVAWTFVALYHDNLVLFILTFYLTVFGFSIIYSALPNMIIEVSPESQTSGQTGVTTFVRYLGQAIGSQLIAIVLSTAPLTDPSGSGKPFVSGEAVSTALWMFVGFCALAWILVWAIAPPRKTSQQELTRQAAE